MIKADERKEEERSIRRSWIDRFDAETEQIQRRFNFFLIAISGFILAFAYLAASSWPGSRNWAAVPVGILGALLSLYFFWINYFHSRIAETVRSRRLSLPVSEDKLDSGNWLQEGWFRAWKFPFQSFKYPGDCVLAYAWFIPFVIFLFWLVIIGIQFGWYGFALASVPAALQIWFSRHTTIPVIQRGYSRTREIMLTWRRKAAPFARESLTNGSAAMAAARQAAARQEEQILLVIDRTRGVARNTFRRLPGLFRVVAIRLRELAGNVYHLFSTSRREKLNPKEHE